MSPHLSAIHGLSDSTLRAAYCHLQKQRPSKKRTDPEATWLKDRLAALARAIREASAKAGTGMAGGKSVPACSPFLAIS